MFPPSAELRAIGRVLIPTWGSWDGLWVKRYGQESSRGVASKESYHCLNWNTLEMRAISRLLVQNQVFLSVILSFCQTVEQQPYTKAKGLTKANRIYQSKTIAINTTWNKYENPKAKNHIKELEDSVQLARAESKSPHKRSGGEEVLQRGPCKRSQDFGSGTYWVLGAEEKASNWRQGNGLLVVRMGTGLWRSGEGIWINEIVWGSQDRGIEQ